MNLHLRKAVDILFVSCLVVGLSACATHLIEDNSKLTEEPKPVAPAGPWQLDDATVEAMVKSGGLVINWIDPTTVVDDLNIRATGAQLRASDTTTIGPGGTVGTGIPGINPVEVELDLLLKIYRAKWDSLKAKIEPRPYVYSKGTATELKDYKTDRVKEVYDWWFEDKSHNVNPNGSPFQHWRMRESHETKNVILVVDRYWNSADKGGWKHVSLDADKTAWMQKPYTTMRQIGYQKMYKELDTFRGEYRTLLEINKLFFTGDLVATLALPNSDPQKAPSLLYREIETFLNSNYDYDTPIYESVYVPGQPISEIYHPDGVTSATDEAVYGRFWDATKTLDSLGYALVQKPTLPTTHPGATDIYPTGPYMSTPNKPVVFTEGVARRGMLFEFFLGNINGPAQRPQWYPTATLPKDLTMFVSEKKKFTLIPDEPNSAPLTAVWTSSAPDTVRVDSITGVVTALKSRDEPVIIKAKLNSGDSLFCAVTVKIPNTWYISSTGSDTKADGTPNSGFYANEPLATPQFVFDDINNPHSIHTVHDSVVNNAGMTWPTDSVVLFVSGLVMEKGDARPNGMLNIVSGGTTPFPTIELRGNPAYPGTLHANSKHGVLTVNIDPSDTVRLAPGVTLRGGAAVDSGAGVCVTQGVFAMSGGEISSNTATRKGGGVYVGTNGAFVMSGGKIIGTQRWNNSGMETAMGRNTTGSGYAASLFLESGGTAEYKDCPDPLGSVLPHMNGNILHAMDYIRAYTDCTLPSRCGFLPPTDPSGSVTVTPFGGSPERYATLADAIAVANADTSSAASYTLEVLNNLSESKTFVFALVGVPITLQGSGGTEIVTMTQPNSRSLFTIREGATLNLTNITLKGVSNNTSAVVTVDAPNANFAMETGSKITGNRNISVNNYGGGAVLVKNGTFTMNGGTIEGNAASLGGGVYVVGDIGDGVHGTFRMGGGQIYGTLTATNSGPETTGTPNVFIGVGLGASLIKETDGVAEYIAPRAPGNILPAADNRGPYYTDCTLPSPP
ncbi:hypothetical protein AGMMS4957_18540 [Bacteroidia bacterium]|nr:hypothetical protein AGMMS4957_18540 [Bacteroidia bacterium]